jgi:DNA-binding transcriptional LysR family regulator
LCLEDDFSNQRLVRLYAEQRTFKRQFYLAWHKDKYLTEGLKTFMAYL